MAHLRHRLALRVPHKGPSSPLCAVDRGKYSTFGPAAHLPTPFVTRCKVVYHKVGLAAMLLPVRGTAEVTVEFFGLQLALLAVDQLTRREKRRVVRA